MKYKLNIELKTKQEFSQDILDCIEEDISVALKSVIANIITKDVSIKKCKMKKKK